MDRVSIDRKLKSIREYMSASNAATASTVDSNANVVSKNVATMSAELFKPEFIDINRALVEHYLDKKFGPEMCDCFEADLKHHIIYSHDETSLMPYCVAVSLYPFVLNGLKDLGGSSSAPKNVESFVGGLCNLIFAISSQFAGAVAVPETLPYMDHFLRITYCEDYVKHLDDVIECFGNRKLTLRKKIENLFQEFVYCVNQPAAARGYQSPFTNVGYFDKGYFDSLFHDFIFPDGDEPSYESTKELQKMFMKWFNAERLKTVNLTFPVETMNLLHDGENYIDDEMADFTAEMWSEGHSFFMYNSDSADALSSCCFEGSEFISVRNINTKEISTVLIKDFCTEHEKDFSNYETMSYNVETDSLEFSKITGVLIKKNEYPNLIRIEADDGSVLKVTPEHVLLVEEIATKQKVEIKAKDLVANFDKYELIKNN